MPDRKKTSKESESAQLDLWITKQESQWEDFKVAREYVQSLRLQDHADWETFVKNGNLKGSKIPDNPEKVLQIPFCTFNTIHREPIEKKWALLHSKPLEKTPEQHAQEIESFQDSLVIEKKTI